jgi:hypothetical protein
VNRKQLAVIWCALLIAVSMVWFPGSWFGYIVIGYPAIRSDSVEFLVKIILPLTAFTLMLVYCLRSKPATAIGGVHLRSNRPRRFSLVCAMLILGAGLAAGFIGGYCVVTRGHPPVDTRLKQGRQPVDADDPFRNFCRREGYRHEVEALTRWLSDEKAGSIGILYNGDDAYSHDLYTYLLQSLPDKKVTVAFSDMYKSGDKSFFQEIKALESAKPEAIIFLGSYEDRTAFMESIAQMPQAGYWRKRLAKIKWVE